MLADNKRELSSASGHHRSRSGRRPARRLHRRSRRCRSSSSWLPTSPWAATRRKSCASSMPCRPMSCAPATGTKARKPSTSRPLRGFCAGAALVGGFCRAPASRDGLDRRFGTATPEQGLGHEGSAWCSESWPSMLVTLMVTDHRLAWSVAFELPLDVRSRCTGRNKPDRRLHHCPLSVIRISSSRPFASSQSAAPDEPASG